MKVGFPKSPIGSVKLFHKILGMPACCAGVQFSGMNQPPDLYKSFGLDEYVQEISRLEINMVVPYTDQYHIPS